MELKVIAQDNSAAQTITVSETAFGCAFNEPLVHQIVTAYLAGARAGTKAQKTRAEVSGGGIKPWRQKGTGRARAGTIRSPLWRKGGKVFAAVPRNYSQKVNKKMYDSAMRSVWSELVRQDRLKVIDAFQLAQPKTKELVKKLQDLNLQHVLVVSDDIDNNLLLAARNLYNVQICTSAQVSPANLIAFDNVLITVKALKKIEEKL